MTKHLLAASASAIALFATAASAEPIVGGSPGITTMNVSATVTEACTDITAADLLFGSQAAREEDVVQTVDISVTCGNGVQYDIELDYGANPAGTQRQLAGSGNGQFIDYDIFQPDATGGAAMTTPWGTKTDAAHYANTGTGVAQTLTGTGVLRLHSTTGPDTYSDVVGVQLNF